MKCVLAFDLGTSGVKAALYSVTGQCLCQHTESYPLHCSADGVRREQCPEDWWRGVCRASLALQAQGGAEVAGIGLSGHSLGVAPVDAESRLLLERTPVWSDARATEQAEVFFTLEDWAAWYAVTGCGFTPALYPLFKLAWYRDRLPEVYRRARFFLGTKDYVNLRMTGVACTDASDASGSGAYDLRAHARVPRYFRSMGVDGDKLPPIVPSHRIIGELLPAPAEAMGLRAGIPVVAGGVDNACMCLGAGCYKAGRAYASLGTSAWVAAASADPALDFSHGIYTFEHCVEGLYVPASGIYSAGSSLNWVAEHCFAAAGENVYAELERLAAETPLGANGVLFCPVLAGGAAVEASPGMKGGFYNLTLGTTAGDIARAAFEGICCDVALAYDSIRGRAPRDESLLLTGGGAKNDLWCQLYAEILAAPVHRTQVRQNAASVGAAALALRGVGLWREYAALDTLHGERESFRPDPGKAAAYRALRARFEHACQLQADLNRWEEEYGTV